MLRSMLLLALLATPVILFPPAARAQEDLQKPELKLVDPQAGQSGYDIRREFDGYYAEPNYELDMEDSD
jgi:hypothetical protein